VTGRRFTELVGCRLPLQLAGMAGAGSVALAAAVRDAGGPGMVPSYLAADAPDDIGVNLLVPFTSTAEAVAAARPGRLVEWFWGEPDAAVVAEVHAAGSLASWQVGSEPDAGAAIDAGVDLVVVQGIEAGGHVRSTVPLLELLPRVRAAAPAFPIVAGGGIGTADDVRRVLDAGADGVRVGTRFVATVESGAHTSYKQALVDESETVLTTAFSIGWPDAPHRVLRRCLDRLAGAAGLVSPPTDSAEGAHYAGEGVGAITSVDAAADVVRELFPT
jgi:NAD(P)H-dependent flavin oxidoreductase YrpB (nitropropane dioxygenase family)